MVIDQGRAARQVESVAVNFAVSESTAHRWAIQDRLKAHRLAVFMDAEGTVDPGTVPHDAKHWRL